MRGALVLGLVAHGRLAPDAAYIEELAVSPTHRRQGIGRALLDECDAIAGLAGKSRITLWVAERNEAAVALYQSRGYRVAVRAAYAARAAALRRTGGIADGEAAPPTADDL